MVAIIVRRLRLPYTVGLVLTGIALSVTGIDVGITLTRDLIFIIILPPLLFEAALGLPWPDLRADAVPVVVLATLGVVVSVAVVALGLAFFWGWPLQGAVIFATLIAATDPVAVIAMFKDNGVTGRVRLLVEGESLLNDGVAAVLFGLVMAWVQGESISPLAAAVNLAVTVGGGIAIGLATAVAVMALAGRTTDHLIETILTAVAAYGSFLAAEHFHVSGILATISAGMVLGRAEMLTITRFRIFSANALSPSGQEFLESFWEFAAFLANSVIFLLIGSAVAAIPFDGGAMTTISVSAVLVLAARAVSVYGLCLPLKATRWQVPPVQQHVLWWGGLRGALALALAMSLPKTLPYRDIITVTTFGVVALSVVVQGITMPSLLRVLDILPRK